MISIVREKSKEIERIRRMTDICMLTPRLQAENRKPAAAEAYYLQQVSIIQAAFSSLDEN